MKLTDMQTWDIEGIGIVELAWVRFYEYSQMLPALEGAGFNVFIVGLN